MTRKIYKPASNAKQVLIALVLTVLSVTANSQATYTLNYTGSVQTLTLQAGTYSVQMWGGDGYTQTSGFNGKGGYASGILTLGSTQPVYIYVGGLGSYPASGVTANAWTFNGGGIGYPASNNLYGNGGGATDIRSVGGAWDNSASLASRAIVAGGGGAGRNSSYIGGNGGGLTGGTGTYFSPDQTGGPTGGSQSGGGSNTGYTSGLTLATSGKAATWDGNTLTANFLAGGGGGYYGGASGRVAGGGGSSYIGGVTSGTTIMVGQTGFVTNPVTSGDGLVIIKELCSFALMTSSSGTANPATICSGTTLTITTNAISNYSWSTGATSSSLVVAPTTNTVYTLTATSPSNCITSVNMSVTVSSGVPVLTLAATPPTVCVGDSLKLNATGALSYTWSNGVNNNQLFPPSQTTTYVVTGKNGCGTTTAAITVTALPLPVSVSAAKYVVCSGSPLTLTVTGATNYTWSTSQTASVIVVSPTVGTTYTVTGKKGSCYHTSYISIATDPLPNVQLVGSTASVCAGTSVTLTASGGLNYTWTPNTFSGTTITDTPTTSTSYQVLGSNSFSCVNGANHVVIVKPLPTITVNSSQPYICPGASVDLTAAGGHTYSWNTGAQTKTISVNPASTTQYTVTGTYTNTGCNDEAYFTVNVDQPTLAVSASETVCPGTMVTMTVNGSNPNWSNGSTNPFNAVTVTSPTLYTVSAKVLSAHSLLCDASGTVVLGMNPQPVVAVTATRSEICRNEKTILTASGAKTYLWMNNNQTGTTQTFSNNVPATYIIKVEGTDSNGCKDTSQVSVKVNACLGLAESLLASVSVFPNPTSGKFTVRSENNMTLQVVNELGQLLRVVELNDQNQRQVQISDLPKGIYFILGGTGNGSIKQKLIVE